MSTLPLIEEQEPSVKQARTAIAGIGVEIPDSDSARAPRVGGPECLGVADRVKGEQGLTTASVAAAAARSALKDAGLTPKSIQQIVVGTSSPDVLWPSTACLVQTELGIGMVSAFDLYAGDASGLTALAVADRLMRAGTGAALVIAADADNQLIDLPGQSAREISKRTIGAAAIVLAPGGSRGDVLATVTDGGAGSSRDVHPVDLARELASSCTACLDRAGITREEMAAVIYDPRQRELIQEWAKQFGIDEQRLAGMAAGLPKGGSVGILAALARALESSPGQASTNGKSVLLISITQGPAWAVACVRVHPQENRNW